MEKVNGRDYDIWCEGFRATGQSSGAMWLGHCWGKNLKDACINFSRQDSEFAKYFNEEYMTYWGCKIFDNGSDARKSFG